MSFEEIFIIEDSKAEEIRKLTLDENLSDIERINYIIKKGYPSQKENLIKNFPYLYFKNYPKNSKIVSDTILSLMENIELKEINLQMAFSKSLTDLLIKMINNKDISVEELNNINMILNYIFISIQKLDKIMSDEYIENLLKIINEFKKLNLRLVEDESMIEFVFNLGKFGQKPPKRKFSFFFCTCLIQILKNRNNNLYKRIEFLYEDSDRTVRYEIAYQVRFIIIENDKNYCMNTLQNCILKYLKENDIILKSILIESILYQKNIDKFSNNFQDFFINIIHDFFIINDYYTISNQFKHIDNTFCNIVNYLYENKSSNNDNYIFAIITYLNKFFYNNKIQNSENVSYICDIKNCLEEFHKLIFIIYNSNNKGSLLFLITSVMKKIYESQENMDIFYNNLFDIFKNLPHEYINIYLLKQIFFFFEINVFNNKELNNFFKSSITDINDKKEYEIFSDSENDDDEDEESEEKEDNYLLTTNNNKNPIKKKLYFDQKWLENIEQILKFFMLNNATNCCNFFIERIPKIIELINNLNDYRIQIHLIELLKLMPKFILNNYDINKINEFMLDLIKFSFEFIADEKSYMLEEQISLLLCQIIRYDPNKSDQIISQLRSDYLNNNSYYKRRLYCFFIDGLIKNFSFQYLNEKKIYTDDILKELLIKGIPFIKIKIIKILNENKFYFSDIYNIISTINYNNDMILEEEIKSYITNYKKENLACNNIQNSQSEATKINEEKKIKEIFNSSKTKDPYTNKEITRTEKKSKTKSSNQLVKVKNIRRASFNTLTIPSFNKIKMSSNAIPTINHNGNETSKHKKMNSSKAVLNVDKKDHVNKSLKFNNKKK